MITLTALVALLALGCLIQNLLRSAESAAKEIVETNQTTMPTPARAP